MPRSTNTFLAVRISPSSWCRLSSKSYELFLGFFFFLHLSTCVTQAGVPTDVVETHFMRARLHPARRQSRARTT